MMKRNNFCVALVISLAVVFYQPSDSSAASDGVNRFSASSAHERNMAAIRYSSALNEANKSSPGTGSNSARTIGAPLGLQGAVSTESAAPPPLPQKSTFEIFTERAQAGDVEALRALAGAYGVGAGDVPKDTAKSLQLWQAVADKGDSFSQAYFGARLMFGDGVQADVAKGLRYVQAAYNKGSGDAAAYLGEAKEKGLVPATTVEIQALYKEAARKGSALGAMRAAQFAYDSGDRSQYAEGAAFAKFASDKNLPEGWVEYALYLDDGLGGVPKNQFAARALFEKAANAGSLRGLGNLGGCLVLGKGGPADITRGLAMWEETIDKGYLAAAPYLAAAYRGTLDGVFKKVSYNPIKARKYALVAAERGDIFSQVDVADDMYNGVGGSVDYAGAVKWARLAAAAKQPYANRLLGLAHLYGNGVEKNPQVAAAFFKQGALLGDRPSQMNHGENLLAAGAIAEGVQYLKAAASQNDRYALVRYAVFLLNADEYKLTPDHAEGFRLLTEAIKRYQALEAYYWLGILHAYGSEPYKNKEKALENLNKAAAGGDSRAAQLIAKLTSN
jgi:uncharacterized protein